MNILILLIYIASTGIQIFSIFLLKHLFITYQKRWLGNIILVLGILSSLLHHLYSYYINSYPEKLTISDSLFMMSNSLIFYAIVLFIVCIFKRIRYQQQKLIHKLKYDSLTRALSRDEILTKCERELLRASRTGEPVSLLTIDMDHFKKINDLYGHPIGDEVLVRSTNYCKELLREMDLIGRIGGDEFVALLPNTDLKSAKEVAERLQLKMKGLINELSTKVTTPISLSIGIACYNPAKLSSISKSSDFKAMLKELINSADKALYEAKKCGRNQCIVAHQNMHNLKTELSTLP